MEASVALVMGFIGCKLVGEYAGVEVNTGASLAVVGAILGGGVVAGKLFGEKSKDDKGL